MPLCCWPWKGSRKCGSLEAKDTPEASPEKQPAKKPPEIHVSEAPEYGNGNPRNKCALQPGHSLMDWIRLGNSGKDLAGTGGAYRPVTPAELASHDKPDSPWIAIKGNVYNITAYLDYHPGGPDEVMRGAGKDATQLFDQVHAWVNFESLLSKCLIGPLKQTDSLKSEDSDMLESLENSKRQQPPKFDWIQKLDSITLIFYTKSWCNPQCCVLLDSRKDISVKFSYDFRSFCFEITLEDVVHWPCTVAVNHETGKVEIYLRKETSKIWKSYGATNKSDVTEFSLNIGEDGLVCTVVDKWVINHNTSLVVLKCANDEYITYPIGYHSRIFSNVEDPLSRSYTPIPPCLVPEFKVDNWLPNYISFMVKKYEQGVVSTWLTSRTSGDTVTITRPLGSFSMQILQDVSQICLIAAGTGLTPMINIILFSLQRRNPRCTRLDLLFFNRSERDILWHDQLCMLAAKDDRFHLTNVLSDPSNMWTGNKGHINQSVLKNHFARILSEEADGPSSSFEECSSPSSKMIHDQYFTDSRKLCICVCGPSPFTQLTKTLVTGLGCDEEKLHCFIG
ncbi:cytochrome b5 reductase 4 [Arctopsyche grandis]|uniref:cytochrome b5 reductase 4 n=1 Tax=Arctopsyche grandis TaxID=121162 RepID=UPI00406D9B01